MRIWFALLAAPILALADQIVSYATVSWACAHQHTVTVHAVHALFLAVVVAGTVPAWQLWHGTRSGKADNETFARRRFLAGLATALGALSIVVIVSMWIPAWVIGPCSD